MRDAVKLGKLEDDKLVGGHEDSDDDLKEIMELVKQGEVENIVPSSLNGSSPQTVEQDLSSLPPPKARSRASRFKVNRSGTSQPAEQSETTSPINAEALTPVAVNVTERRGTLRIQPNEPARSASPPSVPDTPLTITERSSPKLPSGDTPVVTESTLSASVSRKPTNPAESSQSNPQTVRQTAPASEIVREKTPRPPTTQPPVAVDPLSSKPPPSMITNSPSFPKGQSVSFPSMIIDSPDFPPPPGVFSMPPMVIDSPDFPPPRGATSIPPIILNSPDFPPPKGVVPSTHSPSVNAPTPPAIGSPSFPGPPRVMSSQVVERSPTGANQRRESVPGKKVSRFAAERR